MTPELPIVTEFRPEYLRACAILPLRIAADHLEVAAAGEPDPDVIADLQALYSLPVHVTEVDAEELDAAIRRCFAGAESVVELVRELGEGETDGATLGGDALTDLRDLANQAPVVRYVNLLVREAHLAGASDIHLEAQRDGLRTRFRLDGVLTETAVPPRGHQHAIISRIKLLAGLDIAERRKPQDGRIRVRLEERDLDLRIATMPTLHGESVVIRLLERAGRPVSLEDLGMSPEHLATVRRLAGRPNGIILATGPTGSGKTTTLYAAIALRDAGSEKIITIEDPVEYDLPGAAQTPVHAKAGLSFAQALRSILRQDPDVLMVGEMRDAETAGIAVQAAMTGHLVFSTLHTNDAPSAVVRLLDLGVEAYLVAAALEGIVAQRLVRRTCPDCLERYEPDPQAVAYLCGEPVGAADSRWKWERGAGCPSCRGTGFRGRTGIFEVMAIEGEVRRAILQGDLHNGLPAAAQAAGMRTLREDAWRAVRSGLTTVEEVLRVLGV